MTHAAFSGTGNRKLNRTRLGVPVECSTAQRTIQGMDENISASGLLMLADYTFTGDENLLSPFHCLDTKGKSNTKHEWRTLCHGSSWA